MLAFPPRPALIDVKLQQFAYKNKHKSKQKILKLPSGVAASSSEFRVQPAQSGSILARPAVEAVDGGTSTYGFHAPDKLQPVRRGPSRTAGAMAFDSALLSDQRLGRLSPDLLRPVQVIKGTTSNDPEQDRLRKAMEQNFNKETYL